MSGLLPWITPLLAAWCVTAGVIGLKWLGMRHPQGRPETRREPVADGGSELARTRTSAEPLDVETVLGTVLRQLEGDAARLLSRFRLAACENLLVHADRRALGSALKDVVRSALERSPCAAVLVTARRHGGRIEISVVGDGPPESEATLRPALREAEAIFALVGGTIEVDPRPEGAVMRVRLPEFVARSTEPAAEKRAEPGAAAPGSVRVSQRPVDAEARAIT